MAKLCWGTEPSATSARTCQLFCGGFLLQTALLMWHVDIPGLHSGDVLSLCYRCISLAKIPKFGLLCLGHCFFILFPPDRRAQDTLKYFVHANDVSASCHSFIFACWNGPRSSQGWYPGVPRSVAGADWGTAARPALEVPQHPKASEGAQWEPPQGSEAGTLPKICKVLIQQKNPCN